MANKLNITAGYKEGRSYLKDTFFTPPFRVANISVDKSDPALYLMIMSSSPGILDGDRYEIDITIEQNSCFQMLSQSYQRLFNMKTGAEQYINIDLEKGSIFSYVPHPVVPHEQSVFKSKSIIQLKDNCSLVLGEIITCGRKHSGEVFKFSHFQNLVEVYHNQKMILKDNILLQPQITDMNTIGQTENYTHQGTLMYVNTSGLDLEYLPNLIQEMFEDEQDIIFGASLSSENTVVMRMLGNGGEKLHDSFKRIQKYLWIQDTQKQNEFSNAEAQHAIL